MKMLKGFSKSSVFIFVFLLVFVFVRQFMPQAGQNPPDEKSFENYDIRTDRSEAARGAIGKYAREAGKNDLQISDNRRIALESAEKLRAGRNLKIEYNEDLRVPEVVAPGFDLQGGFLTPPSGGKRVDIFRSFLDQNSAFFGLSSAQINQLKTTADYTNPNGVLSFVHFEQRINNIPVFRGEVKAGFTKKGEIVRVINNLAPNLDYENLSKDFGGAEQAVEAAAGYVGLRINGAELKRIESSDLKITFERGEVLADATTAEKFYFPVDAGVARASWRVLLWTKDEAFYVIVDARDGTLLWRMKLTQYQTQTATYEVYGANSLLKTADSPTPLTPGCLSPLVCPQPPLINRQSFTLIGKEAPYTFNNNGWIPDGENRTIGNAVEAGIDRDGTQGIDPNGWAFGTPNRNFTYVYNPAPGNPPPGEEPIPTTQTYPPSQFQQGATTNVFYVVNRWHDEMYLYGFTEQARNFQSDNFGRGGVGGDSISAEIQDSSGTNNANFSPAADGTRPRMQMYVWTNTTPNRDGALDAHIVVHEVTHGLSLRLHGNSSGLSTPMAAGLGEGWSDFYPLALLSEPADDPFGLYPVGGYASIGLFAGSSYYYGARRFPYALRTTVGQNGFPHNPLTLGNLNQGNCATFNSAFAPRFTLPNSCGAALFIGEIWATALWEVRGQLVLRHGEVEGNRRALQIITDAMKLSPLNPTILQSRDAVLTAAQINSAAPATNTDYIDAWRGFAIRGLGTGAQIVSANPVNVVESFDIPAFTGSDPTVFDFDGDGKTDISIFRPSNGQWWINRSSTSQTVAAQFGVSTDKPVPADFTGDGKTDIAFYRPSTGEWFILRSENASFLSFPFGAPSDIPMVGDFDADGKADPVIFRPASNEWFILKSSGGTVITTFGASGDVPVPADYDGDGRADVAIYRPSNGQWWIQRSSNNSVYAFQFGVSTDKPVPGDYTGDGKTDAAFFRPVTGEWFILRSEDSSFYSVPFGAAGDVPAPGDYDGDGRFDTAVFRPSTANWFVQRSTAGILITTFGTNGDRPLPNVFVP